MITFLCIFIIQQIKEEQTKELQSIIHREKEIQGEYEKLTEKLKSEKQEYESLVSLTQVKRTELQEMVQEQHILQTHIEDLDSEHEHQKKDALLKSKRELSLVKKKVHKMKLHLESKNSQQCKLEAERTLILEQLRKEYEHQNEVTQNKIKGVLRNLESRMLSEKTKLQEKISERQQLSIAIDQSRKNQFLQEPC